MKRYIFLLVGVAAIFCACTKSNDNSIPPGFSAKVNGKAWTATRMSHPTQLHFPYVQLGAVQEKDTSSFTLRIVGPITIGQADPFNNSELSFANSDISSLYSSKEYPSHGSFTLTLWDSVGERIEGIFSGVIYNEYRYNDSLVIKDGRFNTAYN